MPHATILARTHIQRAAWPKTSVETLSAASAKYALNAQSVWHALRLPSEERGPCEYVVKFSRGFSVVSQLLLLLLLLELMLVLLLLKAVSCQAYFKLRLVSVLSGCLQIHLRNVFAARRISLLFEFAFCIRHITHTPACHIQPHPFQHTHARTEQHMMLLLLLLSFMA